MSFADQVVLITGASRGIGSATAKAFAKKGAKVIVNYCASKASAEALAQEIGGEAHQADVQDRAAVDAMVKHVHKRYGRIDVLVNNAGITRDTLAPVMEDAEWNDVMAVNVGGAFKVARAVARPMMLARKGRIINVSSVAGAKGGRGQANYAASKAALEGLTRALAVELAPRGILVNAVAPGIIETEMSARVRREGEAEALGKVLLGRFGQVNEVASVVVFLAGAGGSYITGAVIPVDGGFKMA